MFYEERAWVAQFVLYHIAQSFDFFDGAKNWQMVFIKKFEAEILMDNILSHLYWLYEMKTFDGLP